MAPASDPRSLWFRSRSVMKILLDNNITQHFGSSIVGHKVVHARTMGWGALGKGDLNRQAEQ